MRLISLIGTAILLCLFLSFADAAEYDSVSLATPFKIENGHIILAQNAGCNECKRRWQMCRNTCNTPFQMGPTFEQCLIICDTAGRACFERFCL